MAIGEQIKQLRKQQHLTQKQLSEKSGIAEITIRQYEADRYNPKIEALKRLATALNCEVSDIDESLTINKKIPCFAYGLQTLRIDRGLTQKELAKELNVSQKNISNWENGKRMPLFDIVEKIVRYFDTSLLYLFNGEEEYKKSEAIIDENAKARETAIRSAPKFITCEKGAIDYPISKTNSRPVPPKFTDRSTSLEESQVQEEAHSLIDSIPNEESLSWEREKIALQLRDILSTYSELNNAGREAAVKRIEELRYSDVMTDSRLDDIYFNRVKKKISKGEKLSSDEIEWWHNYLDKSVKTVGTIFESLFSMLNEEGRRKAHTQINRAIDQIEMLTKIPEYQKKAEVPPQE